MHCVDMPVSLLASVLECVALSPPHKLVLFCVIPKPPFNVYVTLQVDESSIVLIQVSLGDMVSTVDTWTEAMLLIQ